MSQGTQRFDIVTGRTDGGQIQFPKHAGAALQVDGDSHYTLRLHMFPGTTYFLSKNHGDSPSYTVFSKVVALDGAPRFQNPVGAASLRQDLKTHLEIRLNLFDRRLYMSLFPAS